MQKTQIIYRHKPSPEAITELMELMPHLEIKWTRFLLEDIQTVLDPLYKIQTINWKWFRSIFNEDNDVNALVLDKNDLKGVGITEHWGFYSLDEDTKHHFYLTDLTGELEPRAKANGFKTNFAWMFAHEYLHGSRWGETRDRYLAAQDVHDWEALGILKAKLKEDLDRYNARKNTINLLDRLIELYKRFLTNNTPMQYLHPFPGIPVSQKFGIRDSVTYKVTKHHIGTDWATPKDTHILAPADGSVSDCGFDKTRGYWCEFQTDGLFWYFFHLSMLPTKKDVKQGKVIGFTGNTGTSTGPHCHCEIWKQKRDVSLLTEQNFRDYLIDPETLI